MAETLEQKTRRLRFVRGAPVIVAVLLAGCGDFFPPEPGLLSQQLIPTDVVGR